MNSVPISSTGISKSANQFAVELFQVYLLRHGDKYRNLLLCPYLIYHSLAMMFAGAQGNTAIQLAKMLRIPKNLIGTELSNSEQQQTKSVRSTNKSSSHRKSVSPRQQKDNVTQVASTESESRRTSQAATSTTTKSSNNLNVSSTMNLRSAKGKTAHELRHREFLLLTEQLLHGNHDFIHLASFIYLDKGVKRTEKYKVTLKDYYETKPKKIDFGDIDNLVKTVNEDVARTTENIYSEILSKQEAQKMQKSMFLVSAVFFRGFWLSNFTETLKGTFTKQTSQFTNISMMAKIDYLKVISDSQLDARIMIMPFEASDLQMLLILPNDKSNDSTYLVEKVTAQKLEFIFDEMNKTKFKTVKVQMPVFCVDSGKISIQSTLVQMGASDLFDETKANMSGIAENRPLWLNKIIHRCFIICDERGAITSSAFEKARRRQARLLSGANQGKSSFEELNFDHPFMYIIMDSVTNTILLMGLYTDPKETLEVVHESQLSSEEAHNIMTEGVYKT